MERIINKICEDYVNKNVRRKRREIDYITINEWEVILTYKWNSSTHYREVQKILTHEEFIDIIKNYKKEE